MKRKATLLIKNLETIYTMKERQGEPCVFHRGFIAIHHDEILALGEGAYHAYVDKDTRILDGIGHFAMPSFIEAHAALPTCSYTDLPRVQTAYLFALAKEGTLVHNFFEPVLPITHTYYDVVTGKVDQASKYPIVYTKQYMKHQTRLNLKRFCISAYDSDVLGGSQLLMARFLQLRYEIDTYTVMKALTYHPAKRLQMLDRGVLEKGKQADLLIIQGVDAHMFFNSFEEGMIAHVVKSGVRIFPYVLI